MNDSNICVLILASVAQIVLLIGNVILVFSLKVWANKKNRYYVKKISELEERIENIEVNYGRDYLEVLKENRKLLDTIYNQIKK